MTEVHLHHVALWVRDLERMREFYETALGGNSGSLYENPRTGFRSYFISFGEGCQVELMAEEAGGGDSASAGNLGYAHIALSLGSTTAVKEAVERLRSHGVRVIGEPRTTGDGYYEAIIEDPEGNKIELVE